MDTAAAALAPFEAQADEACGPGSRVCGQVAVLRDALPAAEALAAEWTQLAEGAAEPNAFAEHWFVRAGLRHLAESGEVRLLEVRDGGALIGVLPLAIGRRYGRMPVRHVQNWLHYHSLLGTPLVRAGHEQAFWSAALDALDTDPWAAGFLHINGLVEHGPVHRGLAAAAWIHRRSCDTVHRASRALLQSSLSPQDYYVQTVRKKKRKELKRLQNRLAELGTVSFSRFEAGDDLAAWMDAYLALERSGWKGRAGSSLASRSETEAFFREALVGAEAAGRLQILRMDLDGRPLAMLVNFITPPGSFSFKIAFDEAHARFSPGVLLQLENLAILERADVDWMDSCAVEDHPMINSLWGERRTIVRVSVPLAGLHREATFRLCRTAEECWGAAKRLVAFNTNTPGDNEEDD